MTGIVRYVVEPWVPGPVEAPASTAGPCHLLAPHYQVVPFAGRDRDLADLVHWRDDGRDQVAVRLLHGPAGQGKSRLAARFAEETAGAGWQVSLARQDAAPSPSTTADRIPDDVPGTLVVVEQAERWPVDDLLAMVRDHLPPAKPLVRLLLLARPAGCWWQSLRRRLRDVGVAADQWALAALADECPEARSRVLAEAVAAFASRLGVPEASEVPVPPLKDECWRLTLTVHTAALAAVEAHRAGATPPSGPADVSAYLLERETAHHQALYDKGEITTQPAVIARVALAAALTRALPRPAAVDTLVRAGIVAQDQADAVIDDYQVCYPPVGPDTMVAPPYPDRLAEDFLALGLAGDATAVVDSADPIRSLLTASGDGSPLPTTVATVMSLVPATATCPDLGRRVLFPFLGDHPQLAVAAGGAALTRLAELPDIDMSLLESIERFLPDQRHLDLDVAAAAVATRLTAHRLVRAKTDAERARLHGLLGLRLARAGLWGRALVSTTEAVTAYRRLARSNPAAHEPALANALNNLSIYLSDLGMLEEALTTTTEAVEIRRRLATTNPAAFDAALANALNNLGIRLMNLGRYEEALTALAESVDVYQRLVKTDPAAFEATLAKTLNNLGMGLSNLGRHGEALTATTEAVEIRRRLATTNPAAFEATLASTLDNLGMGLSNLGRHGEALDTTTEAVEIRRRLATTNPTAHEPALAKALTNLGVRLSNLGRHQDALTATTEATDLYRRLARANQVSFQADLARTLNNLGVRLSNLGRHQDALTATTEATDLYRRLARANQAAHEPNLASVLDNLGIRLSNLGRHQDALTATTEAVEIRRRLATTNPTAHEPALAKALTNLGVRLSNLGRHQDALTATTEAAEIRR